MIKFALKSNTIFQELGSDSKNFFCQPVILTAWCQKYVCAVLAIDLCFVMCDKCLGQERPDRFQLVLLSALFDVRER